jgi:hypothetical protein
VNVIRNSRLVTLEPPLVGLMACLIGVLLAALPAITIAQDTARVVARLTAQPATLVLKAGETVPFKVTAFDARGNVIPTARIRVSGPRAALLVTDSTVKAF